MISCDTVHKGVSKHAPGSRRQEAKSDRLARWMILPMPAVAHARGVFLETPGNLEEFIGSMAKF